VYAYKQSIRLIHEFIADEIASQEEASKADYALLLFHQQFGLQPVPLTNTFFNPSLLKLRIAMLQKERSDRDSLLKYGFIAPLFLLMLTLSSATLATKSLAKVEKQMEEISKQTVAPKVPTRTAQEVLANDGINLSSAFIVSPSIAEEMNMKGKKVDETDQPASFKGGLEGLAMYLSTNLKYPAEAQAKKITGKVYIQLVVNVDGKASDFKVLKGLGGGCQEEALRVLQQVEGWIPALSKGKSVSSTLVIPINFML
jgi:TonB family protein